MANEERATIILVGYTKGGATKSTTVTNLAAEYARQGADVLIVDSDKQRTCAKWIERRENAIESGNDIPRIHCMEKLGNIKPALLDAANRYDVVLVDAAGRESRELRIALMTADITLIPIQPSQADLEAMEEMTITLEETHDINPDRKILPFLTLADTSPGSKDEMEAREFIKEFPEVDLMKARLYNRKAYKHALRDGISVIEGTNSKAKAEVQVLAAEVLKTIESLDAEAPA